MACSTGSGRYGPGCSSRRLATGTRGKVIDCMPRVRDIAARIPEIERVVVVSHDGAPADPAGLPGGIGWDDYLHPGERGAPARVRPPAVRPPALHHVFVRHHRAAQVHGARGRRHAAAAPEGARPARRHRARRPRVLLHHLRLDDVELAGERARARRDRRAVRRRRDPQARPHHVGPGRAGEAHGLRDQRQVPRRSPRRRDGDRERRTTCRRCGASSPRAARWPSTATTTSTGT